MQKAFSESKEKELESLDKVNYFFERAYHLNKRLFELSILEKPDARVILEFDIQKQVQDLLTNFEALDPQFKMSMTRDLSLILNLKTMMFLYENQRDSQLSSNDYKHWKTTLLRHREYYAQRMREYRIKLRLIKQKRMNALNPLRVQNQKDLLAIQYYQNHSHDVKLKGLREQDFSFINAKTEAYAKPFSNEVKQIIMVSGLKTLSQIINAYKLDLHEALYSTLVLAAEGKIEVSQESPAHDILIISKSNDALKELETIKQVN